MPGGGHVLSAGSTDATYHLNNKGEVSFTVTLDTSTNGSGLPDTGLYVYSNGSLRLVARTGTPIAAPSPTSILVLGAFFSPAPTAQSGGIIDEQGHVLFSATLANGKVVLVLATPAP